MSLKRVEVFQTQDGAIHKTMKDAVIHELDLYLIEYQEVNGFEVTGVGEVLKALVHQPSKIIAILRSLT